MQPLFFSHKEPISNKQSCSVSPEACKLYYLINNYASMLGTFSMIPAKTKSGNNSRTKKVPSFDNAIALSYKRCPCKECDGFTSYADIQITINDALLIVPMLAMHNLLFHGNVIKQEDLEIINKLNVPDHDEEFSRMEIEKCLIDDKTMMYPINGEKYKELFYKK